MSEPHVQSRTFPLIRFRPYGKPLVNLDIEFLMHMKEDSEIKLGEAYVQIIDEKTIPGDVLDYCKHRYEGYDGRKDRLKNIIDILERVAAAKELIKGKLAFLHLVVLLPEFRKKGLSNPFITMILQGLRDNMDVDYVLMEAWPLELSRFDPHFEKETNRLVKLYSKFGFQKISMQNKNYMFLRLKSNGIN